MITLQDVIEDLSKICEALDAVEVKGRNNSALLVFAWDKCNNLIGELNKAAENIAKYENEQPSIVEVEEVGEENGEFHTEPA